MLILLDYRLSAILPESFLKWCSKTAVATFLANSQSGFAIAEIFHLIGLMLLLGSTLIMNLSVLGIGLKQPQKVAKTLIPWTLLGLALALGTGIPMFMSAAYHYSQSVVIAIKMTLILIAMLIQLAVLKVPGLYSGSVLGKIAACMATLCWFAIAYAGRAIAFPVMFGQ